MVLPRYQQPQRKLYVGAVAALTLLLMVLGWGQVAMVLFLLLLPVLVFFAWVAKQQQHHGVTDREIKQIALCFAAGIFPTSVLALVAQSLLLPLWALLCFYDQRASLDKQLRGFLDADTGDSSSSSSNDAAALTGSGSGALSGLLQAPPPHAPRFADVLQQLDVDKTVGYYVFLFALAFCVAALVEESLKLWIVQGACCCSSRSRRNNTSSRSSGTGTVHSSSKRGGLCHPSRLLFQHTRHSSHAFVVFMAVVAGALGFSFFENVGYVFSAQTFGDRVLAAVLRGCVSTPLHCICGGITGVRLAERVQPRRYRRGTTTTSTTSSSSATEKLSAAEDMATWRTKWRVLAPAIVLHGLFDLQVFIVASVVTEEMTTAHPVTYGLVAPSIGTLALLITGLWYLRRSLHAMEQRMNTGRYIQVAVDLESGRRVGFSDDDSDSDDDNGSGGDSAEDDIDAREREFSRSARKTRSVFNV